MTDKQTAAIDSIIESSDNIFTVEMTSDEIRSMMDLDMYGAVNGDLATAFDESQGHVFGGANPVSYIIIKVIP